MRCSTNVVAALLVLMPSGLLYAQAQSSNADAGKPAPTVANSDEELVSEAVEELRGVMILRISERYLEELFARDIDRQSPVTRIVLGTRARGTAHTIGRADVDTKPDSDGAAFSVKIYGTTTARTVGRNGPAVIHSLSKTRWTARKIVRFDGDEFKTTEATIASETRICPLGAESVLPGLRGHIVSRIASRRAVELNSTAESITNRNTERQVLADVDRVIDGQIAKLNDRVESRPMMALLLPKIVGTKVKLSTSSKCVNISFGADEDSELAKVCPVGDLEPSDTELWFQSSLVSGDEGEVADFIGDAGSWLANQLPAVEIPGIDLTGKAGILPMEVKMVDGWVVLRSRTAKPADVQQQQARHEEVALPSL